MFLWYFLMEYHLIPNYLCIQIVVNQEQTKKCFIYCLSLRPRLDKK